jgi:hypothetical protein
MVDGGGATDGTETVVDLRRSLVSHGCRELKQKAEEEGMRILGVDALAAVTSRNNVRKTARLASLDVFRGLSIAVMILVDNAGGVWPSINHSPWNGVTLADFVMPFFLFIVGVALALTYRVKTCCAQPSANLTENFSAILSWHSALQEYCRLSESTQ